MALDGIILQNINSMIQETLPLRINKISQIAQHEIVFECFNQTKFNLLVSTDSISNRLLITTESLTRSSEPTHFIMLLRKYCENGIIQSSQQIGLDRVIEWKITNRNDLGDVVELRLIFELMGKYANVILVNDQSKIVDAFHRIAPYENTKRIIFTGADYNYPDIQEKKNPFEESSPDLDGSLVSQFHGFSPLLAREVDYRIRHLNESFDEIMSSLKNNHSLVVSSNLEFHNLELKHLNLPTTSYPLMRGLELVYEKSVNDARIKQHVGNLVKIVKRELKRQQSKTPKLKIQLLESRNYTDYKDMGDLLLTYGDTIIKGQKEFVIHDFDNNLVTIPLNETLTGYQNAQKYFQKYRKLKTGIGYLEKQIVENQQQINYLENLLFQLNNATIQDATEIQNEMIQSGLLRIKVQPKKKKQQDKINVNHLVYQGTNFYYGKSNIQNDFLTFKFANKKNWWFHIGDGSGAHVICDADELNEPLLRFGANLAAYYSKYQLSSSVKVNYTQVKHLKKIPQSNMGMVAMNEYKTIYIDPQDPTVFKLWDE